MRRDGQWSRALPARQRQSALGSPRCRFTAARSVNLRHIFATRVCACVPTTMDLEGGLEELQEQLKGLEKERDWLLCEIHHLKFQMQAQHLKQFSFGELGR